jgi:hypothetical protein
MFCPESARILILDPRRNGGPMALIDLPAIPMEMFVDAPLKRCPSCSRLVLALPGSGLGWEIGVAADAPTPSGFPGASALAYGLLYVREHDCPGLGTGRVVVVCTWEGLSSCVRCRRVVVADGPGRHLLAVRPPDRTFLRFGFVELSFADFAPESFFPSGGHRCL